MRARCESFEGSTIASLLALATLVALVACRDHATREECRAMTEHYLDLVIAEDPALAKLPAAQQGTVREMKRELKLGEKSYKKVHDQCDAVTRSERSCAIDAKTARDWEACIKP